MRPDGPIRARSGECAAAQAVASTRTFADTRHRVFSRFWAYAALFLVAAVFGCLLLSGANRGAYDFQAFYCAGAAVRAHADPYKTQPLGACEHRYTDGTYAALPPDVVLPAPQPGYDMAAFAALSALPFDRAKALWGALLAIALTSAIVCTFAATRAPLGTVIAAFLCSLVLPALAFGELFALFAAAACAAMYLASREKWNACAVAAALSLVEPHLGLPLCLALAFWKPQTRAALALSLCALFAIATATLGAAANLEYATVILPLHALAELSSDAQLSLSAVLHAVGLRDAVAVQLGTLSYILAGAAGIRLAGVLAARFGENAFVVAVPAAFATIGGTFMHVTEVFAAAPLALLLLERVAAARTFVTACLVLLAVPWFIAVEPGNALALAVLGALAAFYLVWEREQPRLAAALAAGALTFFVLFAAPSFGAGKLPRTPAPVAITAATYPQTSWRAWNDRALSGGSATVWLLRGLSWTGLLLLACGAVAFSRRDAALSPAPAQSTLSAG